MSEIKTFKCDGCDQIRDDLVTILIRSRSMAGGASPWMKGDHIRRDFCLPCVGRPLHSLLGPSVVTEAIAAFQRRD